MIARYLQQVGARLNSAQRSSDRRLKVLTIKPTPGINTEFRSDLTQKYDRDIFNPLIRAYYGREDYYNVGLWDAQCLDQGDASTNLVNRVLSRAATRTPRLVLDVGCGLGATTNQIKRKWPESRVVGVNISRAQLTHARDIHSEVEFYNMDAARLAFPDAVFDAVVSIEAAFHFNTRADFIGEAYRTLKPGGSLLLADILFEDGPMASAISVWDVGRVNSLPNLSAYQEALLIQGFADLYVEDITRQSWLAWCQSLERWLDNNPRHPACTDEQMGSWRSSLPLLAKAVRHYFIVSARKPLALERLDGS
jgi:ubiquinone/menaquinone biosynthesis C-methylase UbiE